MPASIQGLGLALLLALLAALVAVFLTLVLLQSDSDVTLSQVVSVLGVGGAWAVVILLVSIDRRLRAIADHLRASHEQEGGHEPTG